MFEDPQIAKAKPIIARMLGSMVDSIFEGDFAQASRWCDLPITIVFPHKTLVHETPQDAANALAQQWSHWDGRISWMRPKLLDIRTYTDDMLIVDIEWFMLDEDGMGTNPIYSAYVVRRVGKDYRFAQITSYNEMLERPHKLQ